jgi:methylmalonyl-CoA/ethylmalonyl-CoA epimerase
MIVRFDKFSQAAIVVRDLKASTKHFWEELGVGPWKIWRFDSSNLTDMTLHGNPAEYSFIVGMAYVGDVSIELVQPLEGESIFKEFLNKKGEGIHHLKYSSQEAERIVEQFKKRGGKVLQSARIGDAAFHYLDTESKLGFILEVATGRALRDRPPDEVYPLK